MHNIRCIVLKVYYDNKLLSVTPYPKVNDDGYDGSVCLHSSLEIAFKARAKFEEHIDCGRGSSTFAELGFGVVDDKGNLTHN